MVVDGRAANRRCRVACGVFAFSTSSPVLDEAAEAYADGVASAEQSCERIELPAVKDAFCKIRQPDWLDRYLCFLPIEARRVGLGSLTSGSHLL